MQNTVQKIIELAGGAGNIAELDNCLTRVRIIVKDEKQISQSAAKALEQEKYMPLVNGKNIHVIVGTKAAEYTKALAQSLKNPAGRAPDSILELAGGAGNIAELDNCLTRVRIIVKDEKQISQSAAKALEQKKFVPVINGKSIHVIVGTKAAEYTKALKKLLL